MIFKKNILYFAYFLILFFFLFEIIFGEKNIFTLKNNLSSINNKNEIIHNKNDKVLILQSYLENFKNSDEFRSLVVKDKLFLKSPDEKVWRYELNSE